MLNTTFNSRSAEFDEFLKKLGLKKKQIYNKKKLNIFKKID